MFHILSSLFTLHLRHIFRRSSCLSPWHWRCHSYLLEIYMPKINTLSHQPLNMVDLSLHTNIQRCATFSVCAAHIENDEHSCSWRWYKYRSTNMYAMFKVDVMASRTRRTNNNNFRTGIKPFESNATEHVRVFSTGILNIHVYILFSLVLTDNTVSISSVPLSVSDVI